MSELRPDSNNAIFSSKYLSNFAYVGFFTAFLGAAFKMLHYPFCNELLIIGLLAIAVFFSLASFSDHGKLDKKDHFFVILFCLSMALLTIGLIFKWMHWPGGNEMLIIAIMTLGLYYSLKAFLFSIPGKLDNLLRKMFLIAFSILVVSLLFQMQHWPGMEVMKGIGYLALMIGVLIQFKMVHTKGTWLLNITTPTGYAALVLFILTTIFSLDSSIPRRAVEREFINYEMMDQRMASELKSASMLASSSNAQMREQVDELTLGFVKQVDKIKKEVLRLDFEQAKRIFTNSNDPLLPQKIELRDLVGLEQFTGDDVLFRNRDMIVSSITAYKSRMTALCKKSDNPRLQNLSLDGMITEFDLDLRSDFAPDELYFAFSMNISLLNELSALQYEALKTRTLILSQLK
jgi:hypothetical protein